MDTALILVDMQHDFLPFGLYPQPKIEVLMAAIPSVVAGYDHIYATQLWYPADHLRFAANHPWRYPGARIDVKGEEQHLFPMYAVQDTFGAALLPEVANCVKHIIRRGTQADKDSHSVFYDKKTHPTGLLPLLEQQGIRHVCLLGLDLENTFEHTRADARRHGIAVEIWGG